jgi:hypothetical protein
MLRSSRRFSNATNEYNLFPEPRRPRHGQANAIVRHNSSPFQTERSSMTDSGVERTSFLFFDELF